METKFLKKSVSLEMWTDQVKQCYVRYYYYLILPLLLPLSKSD